LARNGGQQFTEAFLAMNAQALVPVLEDVHKTLRQSLAILAYPEEVCPAPPRGTFCHGESPTIADCCLAPQTFNAACFGVELDDHPTPRAVDAACQALPAFAHAHPERQPDAAVSTARNAR
jgi:glutathione S-transferase